MMHSPGNSISTRILRRLAALAAPLFLLLSADGANPEISREYQLKAVFLYNFARFTEWPATSFENPRSPIIIATLGRDPFGVYLDEAISGEKVNDRPLEIRHFNRVDEITSCHILFISDSEIHRLDHILARLKGRGILTASDMEPFAARGGMVQFITRSNKIQLRINVDAVKTNNLSISSKVLRSADIVGNPGK